CAAAPVYYGSPYVFDYW
nr:immunoglobulin heavy chain junction region [Macaca mulatta]MOX38613.1 immunoglobulin heavy chain junction region [Macaca mulatta]MOX38638.1 immunoglobulin heavy chain junction region [Macaca mulatta]MOX38857.1 immunoglobulin heavy chain junction region [Macaca mulatta]MOX39299.1 immunoglobulin heavy chain junction region [Macaca mulatta]